MTTIAVIIPYYQKKNGILRRALDSILAQKITPDVSVDIIVVDDGSPVPARTEIEGMNFAPPFRLILKEQPNGGVAKARNTALKQVDEETTYIGFLDSDDVWDPEHLTIALTALNLGGDYYFCDNARPGFHDSWLSVISFDSALRAMKTKTIDKDLCEIDKDDLFDFSLRNFVVQLSTFVYRRSVAPNVMFDEHLHASEDHLFLLQILARCNRTYYSPRLLVNCLDGVNIWFSQFEWDSPTHTFGQLCQALAAQTMKRTLPLSQKNARWMTQRLWQLRKLYAFFTMRDFLKKKTLPSAKQLEASRSDATFWLWYPYCLLYVLVLFPLRLYKPVKK